MVFSVDDDGPFYLTEDKCRDRKVDVFIGEGKETNKTKNDVRRFKVERLSNERILLLTRIEITLQLV